MCVRDKAKHDEAALAVPGSAAFGLLSIKTECTRLVHE